MSGRKKHNKITNLTKNDLRSPAVAKLVINENKILKKSLKEAQNRLEKMRQEKFEHEKRNVVLEHKQKTIPWIEFFKFLASAGIGFATNYFVSGNKSLALFFGIPSVVVFIVALVSSKK